jgi:hypothetical protein
MVNQILILQPASIMKKEYQKPRNPLRRYRLTPRRLSGPASVLNSITNHSSRTEFLVVSNLEFIESGSYVWIQEGNLWEIKDKDVLSLSMCASRVVLGPNIDWYNTKNLEFLTFLDSPVLLAPSSWVVRALQTCLPKSDIRIWPAGVDCEYWQPLPGLKKWIIFYVKNLKYLDHVRVLRQKLQMLGHNAKIVVYGQYTQNRYRKILMTSVAVIWIGQTESQGIALAETWAMDVPTMIFGDNLWVSPSGELFESSPAPYFSSKCGQISKFENLTTDGILDFITNMRHSQYSPRSYVLQNFNILKQKRELQGIFEDD